MGEEINRSLFTQADYERFQFNLEEETARLAAWCESGNISSAGPVAGLEQEAWIVDENLQPCPLNEQILQRLQNKLLSPELARFNLEFNVSPQKLEKNCFRRLHQELLNTWKLTASTAQDLDARLVMTGILPTVMDYDLCLENMSAMQRYAALNEQVFLNRKGKAIKLDIVGIQHLTSIHYDVMLESAATSLQLHTQVPFDKAKRYYNASIALSAISVAIAANSPYLFGKQLWEETRIPLFEQAVDVGGYGSAAFGPIKRVSFGSGYVVESIRECFEENLLHFPVLLPVEFDHLDDSIPHLRLHNGTIWRWNRPLIGFDDDRKPHIRIEHRVMAAGPTLVDQMANAAFFYGLQQYYAYCEKPLELMIPFSTAKDNFYQAARYGLDAKIHWYDNKITVIGKLVLDHLLERAETGLRQLNIDEHDIKQYLSIIEQRVRTKQTGANWQKEFVTRNDANMQQMLQQYLYRQQTEEPVHNWTM